MKSFIFRVIGSCLFLQGLAAANVWAGCSPILLDLDQDGIHLGEAGVAVRFDVDCDGHRENMQWVAPGGDEAFLAMDRNGNGAVDDGSELFGVGTPLEIVGGKARDGYEALRQYDEASLGGNEDGQIDPADAVWDRLTLWLDSNADGVSTPEEIYTLQSQAILSMAVDARKSRRTDRAGNHLALWSWAEVDKKPKKMRMVDVFFAIVSED